MIKQVFRTFAALSLLAFAGQVSADSIQGFWNPVDNSADFSWHVNDKGFLIVTVANTSNNAGVITGVQFNLGGGGSVDHLVDVDGTGRNSGWGHSTDARGCYTSDCMITGRNFWNGSGNVGIAAGGAGEFRFFGDFSDLSDISDVVVSFRRTGRHGRGRDSAWGCRFGCDASEVPEPGTLLIFGAGLLGFGVVARRRRQAKPNV